MSRRLWNIRMAVAAFAATAFMASCNDDNDDVDGSFDRGVMLTQMADRLIIPAYGTLSAGAVQLNESIDAFVQNTNIQNLSAAREAWTSAYTDWQWANAYNFGPAGEQGLRRSLNEEVGTWPVNTTKIEDAISSGSWNFNDFNRDARGFQAVEYLLFGKDLSDVEIIELFNDPMRRDYLVGAASDIQNRVNAVHDSWIGDYRSEFISSNGTAAGSSISMLYNEFVKSYEAIKNFKVGLPLGLRPGQIQAEPQLVEAFYSGKSIDMMEAHLTAIEHIWYGRDRNGVDGQGFEEYLNSVTGGPALIEATKAQLEEVKSSLAAVPRSPSASAQIVTAPEPLDAFHTQLQMHTRFFKSDMSSLLGITITFNSGDGD